MTRQVPSLAAALLLLLAGASGGRSVPARPAGDAGLRAWLRSEAGSEEPARTIRYSVAKVDLDGDGIAEAIVYESGPYSCGTGGCELFIARRHGSGWRLVTNVSLVRPPIRVLATKSHGWRDLGVLVAGGGIRVGYEAVLSFDGRTYPENPTGRPARRGRRGLPGETVISDKTPQQPLYP